MSKKIPLIYLVGSGHCGSTLLDMIMSGHSKIIGVGELHHFCSKREVLQKYICSCKRCVLDCSFWKCVKDEICFPNGLAVFRKKIDFLLGRKKYIYNDKEKRKKPVNIEEYLEINEKIYERILKCSGKSVIFDSSKEVNRAELLLFSKKLDIVLVHLVRDGRGVMWSYKRKYGGVFSPLWRWVGGNLKVEILKKRNKKLKVVFIRYEDLVRNPKKEVMKILKEVNLSFEPSMLRFRAHPQHQFSGNRMRFLSEEKIEEDLSWKKNLTFKDLVVFFILGGWLNKFYGY